MPDDIKPCPGLTAAETRELLARPRRDPNCRCSACRVVAEAAVKLAPNPPFGHADDTTVTLWNIVLYANPCEKAERNEP